MGPPGPADIPADHPNQQEMLEQLQEQLVAAQQCEWRFCVLLRPRAGFLGVHLFDQIIGVRQMAAVCAEPSLRGLVNLATAAAAVLSRNRPWLCDLLPLQPSSNTERATQA